MTYITYYVSLSVPYAPSEPDRSSPVRRIVSFPLTLRIDAQMAPLMRLLVYYVREGGETIADSIEVKIAASTQNKVTFFFVLAARWRLRSMTRRNTPAL